MSSNRKSKKPEREVNPSVLRNAMLRRLPRQLRAQGEIAVPAVPALLEHYVRLFATVFSALGRPLAGDELAHLRSLLGAKLAEAFAGSPFSKVVVRYETDPLPKTTLTYWVSIVSSTIADEYAQWVNSRTPPLFGSHPDAKVLELAHSLGVPAEVPAIDIGAGTGRNTFPLARAGFPVDAVELAPSFATLLRDDLKKQGFVATQVFEGNILDPALALPAGRYRLALLAEVVASHFRSVGELRALFQAVEKILVPGGLLVFSAFLGSDGYKPDAAARELSQVLWCCLFTRKELADAAAGLPFERVSDEAVADFERARLPAAAWPPTGWFNEWAGGQDLFDLPEGRPPLGLRWLVYRRT